MKISRLHYITNGASEAEILTEVETVLNAGCDWLQLRVKNEQLDFLRIAGQIKALCKSRATFIINDRVDIAQELEADGVHLGLTDMPIVEARQILGSDKIIGGTANTLEDCLMHQKDGADYIGLGPFRMTTTKKKLSPLLGLGGYQAILSSNRESISIPVIAIGGIQMEDVEQLMVKAGIYGIAVSGLIARAADKKAAIKKLNDYLYDGKRSAPSARLGQINA